AEKPIAGVLFIHGLGEHIERFNDMFNEFRSNDISVLGFDLRGHGRSDSKDGSKMYGHLAQPSKSIRDSIQSDVWFLMDLLCKHVVDVPYFLMGHSLGGEIASYYVLDSPEFNHHTELIAPNIEPGVPVPIFKKIFGSLTSRDEASVERYRQDPLIHPYVTLMSVAKFGLDGGQELITLAKSFKAKSLLVTHGTDDKITSPSASKMFYDGCSEIEDKEYKSFPGYYHELHFDLGKEEVIAFYINWIKKHASING
ncbi:alpha/beta-hydrolase, partial [Rozella allomycis CSF55]